jgi:tripartite-type tricarboxylate transporter receptor subunit TctC
MNSISYKILGSLLLMTSVAANAADNWPARPIRMIAPFPAGSSVDAAIRVIAPRVAEALGQSIVIDNRAGAGGTIGADLASKATPDGYNISAGTTSTHALPKALGTRVAYDPQKDFMPITLFGHLPYIMAVHPSVQAKSLADLVYLAKAKPDSLRYTTVGNSSMARLGGELFSTLAGIRMTPVAYKSSAQSVVDTIAGRIELQFGTMAPVLPHVRAGRLRPLAVTGNERSPALPDVPTAAESGYKDLEVTLWMGAFAPAGTPAATVDRLNKEFVSVINQPAVRKILIHQGLQPQSTTPAQFSDLIAKAITRWRDVARRANLKPD